MKQQNNDHTFDREAIELLKQLIATPSLSKEEENTATLLFDWMEKRNLQPKRLKNNVYAVASNATKDAPVVLLNSHHDTVKPGDGWEHDPFTPVERDGRLIGLGANDAGASLVSLLAAFSSLSSIDELPFRLVIALTAEEEISGQHGIEALLPELPPIDLGIVGEPTQMQLAVAERGLMVLDVSVHGKTGHAARAEGENAIYKAMADINWFRNYHFPKTSSFLPSVQMTVTEIQAGSQHNVVPDLCRFVVDVRVNDCYRHEEILKEINRHVEADVVPRSTRLQPSTIEKHHPVVVRAQQLGLKTFGSATMSDQALMPFNTVKIGPGKSERSHTPNEFVYLKEIEQGIATYIELLRGLEL